MGTSTASRTSVSLYAYPHLYEQLRPPCPKLLDALCGLLRGLPSPPLSVFDPACGSGSWLVAVSRATGLVPFGADNSPEMVEVARARLRPLGGEAYLADAREFEAHRDSFDLAIELSGFACMLADGEDRMVFLQRLVSQMRPGGLIALFVHFTAPLPASLPVRVYEERVPLGGDATALLEYDLIDYEAARQTEWIRRTVTTHGPTGLPPRIVDEYPIRLWTPATVRDVLALDPGLELVAVNDPEAGVVTPGQLDLPEGDKLVVFRRGPAPSPRG